MVRPIYRRSSALRVSELGGAHPVGPAGSLAGCVRARAQWTFRHEIRRPAWGEVSQFCQLGAATQAQATHGPCWRGGASGPAAGPSGRRCRCATAMVGSGGIGYRRGPPVAPDRSPWQVPCRVMLICRLPADRFRNCARSENSVSVTTAPSSQRIA